MTEGYARGAPGGPQNAHRALRDLVRAATVRIHRAGAGYALDEPGTFLGSGFFVAPNWVLTCAHVALSGEGGEVTVVYETGQGRGTATVAAEVATVLPEHVERAVRGSWPAPDLALVRLREPVVHDCAYVTERPAAYYGEAVVFYSGWSVVGGELRRLTGTCTVQGTLGSSDDEQIRLGGDVLPPGVSGGPVVDPVRGEVVGVLKSQVDRGIGGTCTGVEQLRALPVPASAVRAEHDDSYQAVFHGHDRYHRDRQRHPDTTRSTWTDVQSRLGARPGRALSPEERTQLLGRLADLPPPVSTRVLLDILELLLGGPAAIPHPAPRGWRDGLGALYESSHHGAMLDLVLAYTMLVLSADRPFGTPGTRGAEQALWQWVRNAAEGIDPTHRGRFAQQWTDLLRRRQDPGTPPAEAPGEGGPEPAAATASGAPSAPAAPAGSPTGTPVTSPGSGQLTVATLSSLVRMKLRQTYGPDRGPGPSALIELAQRGWEPDRCDWRVCVVRPDGDVERLHEAERTPLAELPGPLAAPLAEAFRRCDQPGRPAALQVALLHPLLGLAVDEWRLGPGEPPIGVQRPVYVRFAGREQPLEQDEFWPYGAERPAAEAESQERVARWKWIHEHEAKAEVLDCDDGLRIPVPLVEVLRGLPYRTVPVLCRYGDHRFEDDPMALVRIVHGGYGVALWRRWHGRPEAVCGEFHRQVGDTVAGPGNVVRLPELVHALRAGLHEGRTEAFWADGIALLYDDPGRPLPGTGDLLEAP
ncbi:VMAP-C domain-containing protein [Streptomyces lutosisoli]|uniref:Trypsin-like peptidase domain-containing protein n=1 Tax=Streptomyces lutosisoli TaxID=2665721 RepID=A0ABW2VDD3_9ACTN